MSIGKNIRLLREQNNMSQEEFGRIAGVTDKAVSTWENDTKEEVDGSNPLNSSSINHIATPFARNCERRLFSFFCRLGHYEGTNSIKK